MRAGAGLVTAVYLRRSCRMVATVRPELMCVPLRSAWQLELANASPQSLEKLLKG